MVNLSTDAVERFKQLRHPWVFMQTCVFTEDETSIVEPIKSAPRHDYLKMLTYLAMREPLLAVFKSRRMWMTWWAIAFHLHYAMTHTHRRVFFVSKKEEDADALVRRAKFIHEHIPKDVWPAAILPKTHYKENHLTFPDIESSINAVAQGSDQLRQYAASRIFMDELGFWEKAKDTYTSSKPTIQAAKQVEQKENQMTPVGIVIISTPPKKFGTEPSFFENLCFDKID